MFLHHFIVCFLQAMPQPTQRTALVRLNSFVISLLICSHNLSEAGRQSDETTTGVKGKKATYCLPPSSHRLPPPGGAGASSSSENGRIGNGRTRNGRTGETSWKKNSLLNCWIRLEICSSFACANLRLISTYFHSRERLLLLLRMFKKSRKRKTQMSGLWRLCIWSGVFRQRFNKKRKQRSLRSLCYCQVKTEKSGKRKRGRKQLGWNLVRFKTKKDRI